MNTNLESKLDTFAATLWNLICGLIRSRRGRELLFGCNQPEHLQFSLLGCRQAGITLWLVIELVL
jgi:hypothetical protein